MTGEITGEGRSNPVKGSCEYSADPLVFLQTAGNLVLRRLSHP